MSLGSKPKPSSLNKKTRTEAAARAFEIFTKQDGFGVSYHRFAPWATHEAIIMIEQLTDTGAGLTGAARYRHEKRNSAVMALQALDPKVASAICAAVLDEISAGSPRLDLWGDIRADAEFWADCANPPELEAYFASALKRLKKQALGIRARKRLIAALFTSLSDAEKRAFLAWAGGDA